MCSCSRMYLTRVFQVQTVSQLLNFRMKLFTLREVVESVSKTKTGTTENKKNEMACFKRRWPEDLNHSKHTNIFDILLVSDVSDFGDLPRSCCLVPGAKDAASHDREHDRIHAVPHICVLVHKCTTLGLDGAFPGLSSMNCRGRRLKG